MPIMEQDEWAPHAEKEWGSFTKALGKNLPRRLTQLRRSGKALKALTATTPRKAKR